MTLTFLGHSCFLVEGPEATVLFDPFLSGNPLAARKPDEVRADAILLTHGHSDHVGDTAAIARRLNIPVVAVFELATVLAWEGCETHGMNTGGSRAYPFGTVKYTHATHSAGLIDEASRSVVYCGDATGILYTQAGRTVYHLGDTGLTSDLAIVGRRHAIDVALVPIGDHFTMGPDDAAEAVRMLGPKRVVPCHYNTFDLIRQDPREFVEAVGDAAEVQVLQPGETLGF